MEDGGGEERNEVLCEGVKMRKIKAAGISLPHLIASVLLVYNYLVWQIIIFVNSCS